MPALGIKKKNQIMEASKKLFLWDLKVDMALKKKIEIQRHNFTFSYYATDWKKISILVLGPLFWDTKQRRFL